MAGTMTKLEELTPGTWVKAILPDALVNVIDAKWHGSAVVELTYKDAAGRLGTELVYWTANRHSKSHRPAVPGASTATAGSSASRGSRRRSARQVVCDSKGEA